MDPFHPAVNHPTEAQCQNCTIHIHMQLNGEAKGHVVARIVKPHYVSAAQRDAPDDPRDDGPRQERNSPSPNGLTVRSQAEERTETMNVLAGMM